MTTTEKIVHYIVGISVSFISSWSIDYLFGLANIGAYSSHPNSKILLLSVIAVSLIVYWLVRKHYPLVAKGILIGLGLTVVFTWIGITMNSTNWG